MPRKSELIGESAIQASLRKQKTNFDAWSNRPASTRVLQPQIHEYDKAFAKEGPSNTFSPIPPRLDDNREDAVTALKNEMSSLRDQLDEARSQAADLRAKREADVDAARKEMRL